RRTLSHSPPRTLTPRPSRLTFSPGRRRGPPPSGRRRWPPWERDRGGPDMTRMPFGRHRGEPVADVPTSYLAWYLREATTVEPCVRRAIARAVARRVEGRRDGPRPPPARPRPGQDRSAHQDVVAGAGDVAPPRPRRRREGDAGPQQRPPTPPGTGGG